MEIVFLLGRVITGWMIGLLVNYLADVLPLSRSLSFPLCRQCCKRLPIIRYISFQRCSECGSRRPLRTWIVQLMLPFFLVWLSVIPPGRLFWWMDMDFEHRAILVQETAIGLIVGFAAGIYLHGIISTILGGLAGFAIMLVLYYLGIVFARWLSHIRSQENTETGLGFGDVSLSGVIGLMLGWPGILAGLVLAILLAGMASAFYLVYLLTTRRYKLFSSIPYGPFLVLGTAILLFRP
jgi:leader peptidase (prepilin peptidase)/N-methyltransferase